MSTWIPTVKTVTDNIDPVSGTTVNQIFASLAARDQYLYDQFNSIAEKSVIMAYQVPAEATVVAGDVVYYQNIAAGTNQIKKALATYQTSIDPSHLIPAESAFVFGIVKSVADGKADVYLRGLISVTLPINDILDANSLASGRTTGPLYLSSLEAGKLTFYPGGAGIFVGVYIKDNTFYLSPNIDSLNQLYFNYKVYLITKAANASGIGTEIGGNAGHWTIANPDFTKTGWVNASDAATQYGIVSPTNAKFYYNLPSAATITADSSMTAMEKKDALLLKESQPPYPAAFTQLFMNGSLQLMWDSTDHTNGNFTIDNNGIWWFNDATNYIPWKQTVNDKLDLVLQTTKLNPNFKSAIVSSISAFKDGSNDSTKLLAVLDKASGSPATTGDIALKVTVPIVSEAEAPVTGTFVKNVVFDAPNGQLKLKTGTGIVDIVAGAGIQAAKNNGTVTLSLLNYTLSGEVTDIEPEEADFVYKGLHSYLKLKNPTINSQKIGFVGKVRIPNVLPVNTGMKIKLLAFSEDTNGNAVNFKFSYSISSAGSLVSATMFDANSGNNIAISGIAKDVPSIIPAAAPLFEIPSDKLVAGGYVNFRVSRTISSHTPAIGVLGITWAIE